MTAAPRPAATVRSPEQVAVVARNTQPQHERAKRKAAQGLGAPAWCRCPADQDAPPHGQGARA